LKKDLDSELQNCEEFSEKDTLKLIPQTVVSKRKAPINLKY
jgi:hypothetical protein